MHKDPSRKGREFGAESILIMIFSDLRGIEKRVRN
jgi:hypothetical protein